MKPYITVDLGFGDAGKGTIVEALVRQFSASLVVRYNGGGQAGHSVVTDDGRHHTFAQFGAGTFVPRTYTLLSRYMIVNPLTMQTEEQHLQKKGVFDAFNRTFIDGRALMTTPYHRALNRLKELSRGDGRHGSCGMGVGDTVEMAQEQPVAALRMGDLHDATVFTTKLAYARAYLRNKALALKLPDTELAMKELSTFDVDLSVLVSRYADFIATALPRVLSPDAVASLLSGQKVVVFEGAQGVLLDETFGFPPYHTWSCCTTANARLMLDEAEVREPPTTIGITRSYMVRHGPGPFPSESQELTRLLPDKYNVANEWQRQFRCGHLDLPLLRYALSVAWPVDYLAITHMDALAKVDPWRVCTRYDMDFEEWPRLGFSSDQTHKLMEAKPTLGIVAKPGFVDYVSEALGKPVGILSSGPAYKNKQFCSPGAVSL